MHTGRGDVALTGCRLSYLTGGKGVRSSLAVRESRQFRYPNAPGKQATLMTASEVGDGGRPTARIDGGGKWYGGWAAISAYSLIALQVLCFAALALADPEGYRTLAREGRAIENLTAAFQLCAGLLLFATAWLESKTLPRIIYILGGALMLFFAGEEISWGQQILGFATPNALADINYQNEFNIHNIDSSAIDKAAMVYDNLRLPLCIVAVAALLYGKGRRLLEIPLPTIPLLVSTIVADAVLYYNYANSQSVVVSFIFHQSNILILILTSYAIISKQAGLLLIVVTAAAIIGANAYAMSLGLWEATDGKIHEVQEYLFSCVYLWYAIELLAAQGRLAAFGARLQLRFAPKLRGYADSRQIGTAICGLIIAASIGLALFVYSESVRQSDRLAAVYTALITDTVPLASSESPFDIYSSRGQLHYIKEDCAAEDIEDNFFLHIYPVQVADLPAERRQHGFENRDFSFGARQAWLDDLCLASVPLPGYPIDLIRTGQYLPGGPRVWEVEFAALTGN